MTVAEFPDILVFYRVIVIRIPQEILSDKEGGYFCPSRLPPRSLFYMEEGMGNPLFLFLDYLDRFTNNSSFAIEKREGRSLSETSFSSMVGVTEIVRSMISLEPAPS